jgi:hypothetical protein
MEILKSTEKLLMMSYLFRIVYSSSLSLFAHFPLKLFQIWHKIYDEFPVTASDFYCKLEVILKI